MNIFLKAKHWQIFLLSIGIPVLLGLSMVILKFTNNDNGLALSLLPVFNFFYIVVFYGWFWAIGTKLHDRLPEGEKVNLKLFKMILAIPIVYLLIISSYSLAVVLGIFESNRSPEFAAFDIVDKVMPLHIISICCIFYAMWINAKTIKSVELQRPVKFADFAGEFIQIWFFPIGIWTIQPLINKLVEEE